MIKAVKKEATSNFKNAHYVLAANRVETFANWPFNEDDSPCKADKMAEAGFINTTVGRSKVPSAKCVFCNKELYFEEGDNPWHEHVKRGEECVFVKLNKLNEHDWIVKDYLILLGTVHNNFEVEEIREQLDKILGASDDLKKTISTATKKK